MAFSGVIINIENTLKYIEMSHKIGVNESIQRIIETTDWISWQVDTWIRNNNKQSHKKNKHTVTHKVIVHK